jgi:hypothetical protein
MFGQIALRAAPKTTNSRSASNGRVGEIAALLDGIGELREGVDPVVDRAA